MNTIDVELDVDQAKAIIFLAGNPCSWNAKTHGNGYADAKGDPLPSSSHR